MLNGVRESMYPRKSLQIELPDLGQAELLPGVSDAVTRAVDLIATQSGIDLDELHTATLDKDGKVQLAKQQQHAAVDKAHAKAKDDVGEEGKKSADSISGAKAGADAAVDQKLLEASGGASPARDPPATRPLDRTRQPTAGSRRTSATRRRATTDCGLSS